MNKAMLTVGLILLAIVTFFLINTVQNYSTGGDLDYYLLKETTEAAMVDSIDESYYQNNGQLRVDKERFVESFVRRFADTIDQNKNYKIDFYDLNETPPKVSVKVSSSDSATFKDIDITTSLNAVLESNYKTDILTSDMLQKRAITVQNN